ncbi:MAG: nicotinate-nucleotide diphosphorylase (carboxylating), partial [Actinomycetota bacterium]
MTSTVRPDLLAPLADIRFLVERALTEDLTPLGDLTSALLDPELQATATFGARESGVLSGCRCVEETFALVDPTLTVTWNKV